MSYISLKFKKKGLLILLFCLSSVSYSGEQPLHVDRMIDHTDTVAIGKIVKAELVEDENSFTSTNLFIKPRKILRKSNACRFADFDTIQFRLENSKNNYPVGSDVIIFFNKVGSSMKLVDQDSIFLLDHKGEVDEEGNLLSYSSLYEVVDFRESFLSNAASEFLVDKIRTIDRSNYLYNNVVVTENIVKLDKLVDYLVNTGGFKSEIRVKSQR